MSWQDIFIVPFRSVFGDKANFYACLIAFAATEHGRKVMVKFVEFILAGIEGLKSEEGKRLLEEYKRAFPDE